MQWSRTGARVMSMGVAVQKVFFKKEWETIVDDFQI